MNEKLVQIIYEVMKCAYFYEIFPCQTSSQSIYVNCWQRKTFKIGKNVVDLVTSIANFLHTLVSFCLFFIFICIFTHFCAFFDLYLLCFHSPDKNNVVVLVHYAIIHSSKTIDFFFFLRLFLVVFHYKFSFDSLPNGNFDCSVDQIESFKNHPLFIYCMLSILWRFFYFYCFAIFDPIPVISFLCRFILVEIIESSMQNHPTRSFSYWNCVPFLSNF